MLTAFLLFSSVPSASAGWTDSSPAISDDLYRLYFLDANTGWAVGKTGVIQKYSTGSWSPQTSGVTDNLRGVAFTDANNGIIVGSINTFLRTTDGGSNWNPVAHPVNENYYSVIFVDANIGFASGGNGTVIRTDDGGATWADKSVPAITDEMLDIDFPVDGNTGFVVGQGGVIYKTTDGGNNWVSKTSGVTVDLWGVHFPVNTTTGYAVGQDGTALIKTTNGGDTWVKLNSGTSALLNDVFFLDNNTGYILGDGGVIRKTTDGGTTWLAQDPGSANNLMSVQFLNANTGFVAAFGGTVIKTTDAGGGAPTALHPTGLGSVNGFGSQTGCGAGSHWDCINDQAGNAGTGTVVTDDNASSYLQDGNAASNREMFALDNGVLGGGATITSVEVFARVARATGGPNPGVSLSYQRMPGATTPDGSPINSASKTVSTSGCCDVLLSEFWSGLSWTNADLDNLQIGIVHNSGGTFQITQLYVYVTYTGGGGATTTIGDGTTPANKTIYPSDTNKAVDVFTLVTSSGTDTLTDLTVTRSGTSADSDVSAVKIYEDKNGNSEYDAGDEPAIASTTLSGGTASFTGLSIGVTTSVTPYLITYDIAASPSANVTLLAAITSATVTINNPPGNNDNTDATLTTASACSVVRTTDDTAIGSLRGCITWANGNAGTDTIILPANTYTLTLTGAAEDANASGDLDITESLDIVGDSMTTTLINGNATTLGERILHITAGTVTITDLSLQNDNTAVADTGGGIRNDGTSLTMTRVSVTGNRTSAHGGGIYTNATMTLTDVEVDNNHTSAGDGGAIYILNGTNTWTGVTLSNNSASGNGGAIRNGATLNVFNTTISNNSATSGSAFFHNATATFTNTTFYGNTGSTAITLGGGASTTMENTIMSNPGVANCQQALTSSGGNLETGGNTCGFTTGTDQNTVSVANLNINATLADNGGATKTHALNSGSFAIDEAVSANCLATDQRGIARGFDGNGTPNNPEVGDCDIGAYEFTAPPTYTITGKIFEDANFTGTAAAFGGGDQGLQNVEVELYNNATNNWIQDADAQTDINGDFTISGVADGTYKVRVRAATIADADTTPAGGLNASVPATWPYPLPEMTWGNGSAVYGGQSATVDDTATGDNAAPGPGDTYVTVTVSGGNVTNVNFGFAYNLIVNVDDDSNIDSALSKQGSLRQFIKNANAIGAGGGTTASSSEFRMQVATNQSDGSGNNWWRIAPGANLPAISDAATTLDGSRQRQNTGSNDNALGPEIEIYGAGILDEGVKINNVANALLQELAINSFTWYGIQVTGASATGADIFSNYLGTDATGTVDMGNGEGIRISTSSSDIDFGGIGAGNVVSGNTEGIFLQNSNLVRVYGNKIGTNALGTLALGNSQNGIKTQTAANTTIGGASAGEGNIIASNGFGIQLLSSTSNTTIKGNTFGTGITGAENLG